VEKWRGFDCMSKLYGIVCYMITVFVFWHNVIYILCFFARFARNDLSYSNASSYIYTVQFNYRKVEISGAQNKNLFKGVLYIARCRFVRSYSPSVIFGETHLSRLFYECCGTVFHIIVNTLLHTRKTGSFRPSSIHTYTHIYIYIYVFCALSY